MRLFLMALLMLSLDRTSWSPAHAQTLVLEGSIRVHVQGQVRHPGLYRLARGSRNADAIQAAGGPLPGAGLDTLNLALPLTDGASLNVPKRGATPASQAQAAPKPGRSKSRHRAGQASVSGGGVINLNSATLAELDSLPGIGESIAGDIMAYRTRRGGFRSLDELREVPGIGERRLNRLKPRLRL